MFIIPSPSETLVASSLGCLSRAERIQLLKNRLNVIKSGQTVQTKIEDVIPYLPTASRIAEVYNVDLSTAEQYQRNNCTAIAII